MKTLLENPEGDLGTQAMHNVSASAIAGGLSGVFGASLSKQLATIA